MTEMELLSAALDIRLKPERPEAGAEMEIRVAPADGAGAAPEGAVAVVRDADGQDIATAPLQKNPDDGAIRAVLRLAAPDAIGDHRWSVSLQDAGGEIAAGVLTFAVGAHAVRPSVWNLPPAITAGERFGFTVGLACAAGCAAAGWGFVLEDQDGRVLQSAMAGPEPLPGTAGVHGARIDVVAPSEAGRHVWRLRPVQTGGDGLHAPVAVDVHLNVVRRPDRVIRVRARDAASGAPVARARVVAHPFRAMTDADGLAELAVPAGAYRLFVSGPPYFPFRAEIDTGPEVPVEILAEMHHDRPFDETDQWS
jgi:hypothetical protein